MNEILTPAEAGKQIYELMQKCAEQLPEEKRDDFRFACMDWLSMASGGPGIKREREDRQRAAK